MLNESLEALSSGVDQQVLLEEECLLSGGVRYTQRVTNKIQGKMESLTDYGKRLAAASIDPVAQGLTKWLEESKKGAGRKHYAAKYLELVSPDVAALIALRCVLDCISTRSVFQNAAVGIGRRIEDEVRFGKFEELNGGLYKTVEKNLKTNPESFKASTRRAVMVHAMNKFAVAWTPWSKTDYLHVGTKMIDLIIETTGLVQLARSTQSRNTLIYLESTPKLAEQIDLWKEHGQLFSPEKRPMICPPLPWLRPTGGGYLTERMQHRLVKTNIRGHLKELENLDMPTVYNAINALQNTAWKVNAKVLDTVRQLWDAGLEVGDLASRVPIPLPPKPDYVETEEGKIAWREYKLKAAEVFRSNRRCDSKRMQSLRLKLLAEEFENFPAVWFPVRLDFRGRMYFAPQYLNPQGNDLAKGLLTFAEGKPLGSRGAYWLKVHLANCYGEDKVAMRDRLRWVDQNYTKIVACAEDPIANRWWMDADKPFQFLAACFEFAGYDAEGNNYVCSLPIQVDGSCNGLQHYAAMLRDPVSGAHVNLVPAPKPADIYAEVATHVEGVLRTYTSRTASNADEQAQIDIAKTWLKYGISRAMTKRPVMVLPYGGTREAVKVYVEQYVHEQHDAGVKRPFTNRELRRAVIFLSDIIWRVMGAVVVGPRTAMDWLQSASKTLAAELLPINWTTPSGFLVMQRYPNIEARRVKTKIGDVCVKLTLNGDKPTLDKRKQAQAIAPNFVHSLDASALMLTIQLCHARGITAFSAIHDSYGTLAADMDTLAQALREVFVEMYAARDVLVDFAKEVSGVLPEGKTLPDLPEKGSLDLAGVLSSEFFFA